jgi:DNA-binding transcriptional regulator YiaG
MNRSGTIKKVEENMPRGPPLTQAQFAEMLGASLDTVRKWEIGERSPSGAAATLIRVLGYDPTS